jgi:DNA-binding response OmpR family regulator
VPGGPRVLILADDLIWADRLARAVTAAGGTPVGLGNLARFEAALVAGSGPVAETERDEDQDVLAIVDLTARAYDGIDAIGRATAAGVRVLAVGQHDDHDLRKRALAAGAERAFAYQKLFADGPSTIAAFLAGPSAVRR